MIPWNSFETAENIEDTLNYQSEGAETKFFQYITALELNIMKWNEMYKRYMQKWISFSKRYLKKLIKYGFGPSENPAWMHACFQTTPEINLILFGLHTP